MRNKETGNEHVHVIGRGMGVKIYLHVTLLNRNRVEILHILRNQCQLFV